MRVSVLDQSLISAGEKPGDAIRNTLALAEACERLGYARFWVSEHHNNPAIAGSAPEVLLGALAMRTKQMRIGSAGVMLPHYAPLKVAEQFRVLEALAPGRMDLGLGRGPGADRQASYALKPWSLDNPLAMSGMDTFAGDVSDVVAWTNGDALEPDHPFAGVVAQPCGGGAPEAWIVGSSAYTAHLAAHYGLPYCFAHFFFDGEGAREALKIYMDEFRPSRRHPLPLTAVCAWAIAADDPAEADALFADYALWRMRRDRGTPAPLEKAPAAFSRADRDYAAKLRARTFFGRPDDVARRLLDLCGDLGADELVIVTSACDPDDRLRSYARLAEALRLEPRTGAAAGRLSGSSAHDLGIRPWAAVDG